jgi:hypothetical protein
MTTGPWHRLCYNSNAVKTNTTHVKCMCAEQ